ncbi:hypothetical protein PMAYCL1PPCAC_03869 [Pristionchus mayeri]|uniref:Uncharacterized protein n=1 Tax=Pristionchus mayeri TaxID=1317129 RepID=A0AAN4Z5U2_9BILA|nr:hypothetical protein PMAYCL1PPCAC_03869 [Pristionchus mayeri]
MIFLVAISLFLAGLSIDARQYPACAKWCGKDDSDERCECPNAQPNRDCLKFDPTMYATTLDEALYNFPNLVSNDKKTMFNKAPQPAGMAQATMQQQDVDIVGPSIMSAPPMPQSPGDPAMGTARGYSVHASADVDADADCSSVSCRSCKLNVVNGFLNGPVDPATNASLWAQKEALEATLNGITPSCPQNACPQTPPPRRGKRQNTVPEQDVGSLLGNTQTISCDYTRGNPVSIDTRFCGLCSLCWGWRKLPEDYYPNYLNEVLCSTDTTCLQGFGKCNAVTRSINVLRKKFDANGGFTYEQTTIDTVTSCECQVEYGSTIFNLVYSNDATENATNP